MQRHQPELRLGGEECAEPRVHIVPPRLGPARGTSRQGAANRRSRAERGLVVFRGRPRTAVDRGLYHGNAAYRSGSLPSSSALDGPSADCRSISARASAAASSGCRLRG